MRFPLRRIGLAAVFRNGKIRRPTNLQNLRACGVMLLIRKGIVNNNITLIHTCVRKYLYGNGISKCFHIIPPGSEVFKNGTNKTSDLSFSIEPPCRITMLILYFVRWFRFYTGRFFYHEPSLINRKFRRNSKFVLVNSTTVESFRVAISGTNALFFE